MTEEVTTRYIADDGKVFKDPSECRKYERSLVADDVILLDDGEEGLTQLETDENNVEDCVAIIVKTLKGAKWVQRVSDERGLQSPFDDEPQKTGIFIYDSRRCEWVDWEVMYELVCERDKVFRNFLHGEEGIQ